MPSPRPTYMNLVLRSYYWGAHGTAFYKASLAGYSKASLRYISVHAPSVRTLPPRPVNHPFRCQHTQALGTSFYKSSFRPVAGYGNVAHRYISTGPQLAPDRPSTRVSRQALTRTHLNRVGPQAFTRVTLHVAHTPYVISPVTLGRSFHATQPARAAPALLLWLAAVLKSSAALNFISMFGRFTLSLLPWAWVKERMTTRALRLAEEHPEMAAHPRWQHVINKHGPYLKPLRYSLWVLGLTPLILIAVTCIASAERAPITGRWRIIMLSPDEEERIHHDLKGYGWFASVIQQVTNNSPQPPQLVPPNDWRWAWVESTLRKLEAGIAIVPAADGQPPTLAAQRYYSQPHDGPVPPPAAYPLLPRPRLSQLVHSLPVTYDTDDDAQTEQQKAIQRAHPLTQPEHHSHHHAPHSELGPPYNLLILDKPECNAFSHGYGPSGGGGVVVYTGFLDEILTHNQASPEPESSQQPGTPNKPLSGFLSLFTPPPSPRPPRTPQPTPEQTEALAVVLAHELAHLILCHHLESLSSSMIVMPTLLSMLGDIGRTIIFPFTMFFGPFLNDAIANVFKVGHRELQKTQLECRTKTLEIEADAVSARLLAYAGFDARCAVDFWAARKGSPDLRSTSSDGDGEGEQPSKFEGGSHPLSEVRLASLKAELERWNRWKEKAEAAVMPQAQAAT